MNSKTSHELTHLSLFTGIGGIDFAAEWAGFETVGQVEKNEYCQKVLTKHWPDVPGWSDIKNFYWFAGDCEEREGFEGIPWCPRHDEWYADCKCIGPQQFMEAVSVDEITLISGGFPCKDISNAKTAQENPKGLEGDSSGLWYHMLRVIRRIQPRWAFVENASGLNVRGLPVVTGGLSDAGYDSVWFPASASRFGSPHRRRRTFVVAYSNSQGQQGNVCRKLANKVGRRQYADSMRSDWWGSEPDVDRVANGTTNRSHRIKALGNAVVPQQVYPILKGIAEIEKEIQTKGVKE